MRPFDKKRCGTLLGDGGAMLVMESLDSALKRGARIYCEVVGYHANCMGTHAVRPDETGNYNFETIRTALLEANLLPGDVDMVNAHATSTPLGDVAEVTCLKKMFYNEKIHNDKEAFIKCDPSTLTPDDLGKGKLKRASITAFKGHIGHL
jgi:3-oxoacyl-(acyl-carrier-protein) synthase